MLKHNRESVKRPCTHTSVTDSCCNARIHTLSQGSRLVNSIAKKFGRQGERAAKEGDREADEGLITFDDGKQHSYTMPAASLAFTHTT